MIPRPPAADCNDDSMTDNAHGSRCICATRLVGRPHEVRQRFPIIEQHDQTVVEVEVEVEVDVEVRFPVSARLTLEYLEPHEERITLACFAISHRL